MLSVQVNEASSLCNQGAVVARPICGVAKVRPRTLLMPKESLFADRFYRFKKSMVESAWYTRAFLKFRTRQMLEAPMPAACLHPEFYEPRQRARAERNEATAHPYETRNRSNQPILQVDIQPAKPVVRPGSKEKAPALRQSSSEWSRQLVSRRQRLHQGRNDGRNGPPPERPRNLR
jgi:hypothetical protein